MVALTSLVACRQASDSTSGELDYSHVVDVSLYGWGPADTLFFPVEVTWPAHVRTPLRQGLPYDVHCSVRMEGGYRLSDVPMCLIVQQTDTLEDGHTHVIHNLLRQEIAPVVRDSLGLAFGSSWGSLIDYQTQLDGLTLQFDSVGTYRMLLIPRTGELPAISGISAIGLHLYRRP